MEHQRRTQASFTRWEQERWRQERESMERWRQEARDHERALFGMFCTAMSKCNAAITAVLKAKNTSVSNSAAAAAGRFNNTRCSSNIGYLRCAVYRPGLFKSPVSMQLLVVLVTLGWSEITLSLFIDSLYFHS